MKKVLSSVNFIILLAAVIYATENTYAQKEKKNYVSVNYSFGSSNYHRYGMASSGFQTYADESDNFKSVAVEYARWTNPNVEFCTGLAVTAAYLATASTYHPVVGDGSGSRTSIYRDEIFIFSLPLHVKYHFWEYLFVEGGVDLNCHSGRGYKYGAGLSAGIGAEYVFHSGITLYASPFGRWNLLMGNAGAYSMTESDSLSLLGIKLGIGYRF
jgi:hypothetical protein